MSRPEPMDARRRVELARIHIQTQQLGIDEVAYRMMLKHLTGCESAGEMTAPQRAKVLDHLSRQFRAKRERPYPGRPHNIESPRAPRELARIEAFLAESKRPWAYADAMAKRIAKVECCTFLDEDGARKVLAALACDAARHGRRTA